LRVACRGRTTGADSDNLPHVSWRWDIARAFSSEVDAGSREETASK
jgi:hypothetical protein